MKIQIACDTKDHLPYNQLVPFQGELKTLSKENYEKLKKEITETGFAFPIMVWKDPSDGKNYCLGGHQRQRAIKQMVEREGYECPDLPVIFVSAKNKKEAKRRIIQDVAQYGHVDDQGLYEFMADAEIEMEDLKGSFDIPNMNLKSFEDSFFKQPEELDEDKEEDLLEEAGGVSCPECGHKFSILEKKK